MNEFEMLVKERKIVIGCELTKKTHQGFDRTGEFTDHLSDGAIYNGAGDLGVEIEIRGTKIGADTFVPKFKGAIGISELADDRVKIVQDATVRLVTKNPEKKDVYMKSMEQRILRIRGEEKILLALSRNEAKGSIENLVKELVDAPSEIAAIDGISFKNWALSKAK